LRVADLNDRSASGAARILQQPHAAPAAQLDEAEVDGIARQRRVALKSPPIRRLPPGGGQQPQVAGDFNLRGVVYTHFNRASAVPAATGNRGPAGHRIRMRRRYQRA
jgi:hypothetical protein